MESSLLLIWMSSISATREKWSDPIPARLRITEILHRGRRISNNEVELWIFWIINQPKSRDKTPAGRGSGQLPLPFRTLEHHQRP